MRDRFPGLFRKAGSCLKDGWSLYTQLSVSDPLPPKVSQPHEQRGEPESRGNAGHFCVEEDTSFNLGWLILSRFDLIVLKHPAETTFKEKYLNLKGAERRAKILKYRIQSNGGK